LRAGLSLSRELRRCARVRGACDLIQGEPTGSQHLIIIVMVVPGSRMVTEMKPHSWAEVHGYARPTVVSPIANVILVNVTTVV
jgi:hypothetical protein